MCNLQIKIKIKSNIEYEKLTQRIQHINVYCKMVSITISILELKMYQSDHYIIYCIESKSKYNIFE